ncbi:hypothetical protein ACLB6G_12335 [Zhengella sp. ZM62]|uniref:hypothetical protein n=1 Tax=Zhengella sedimenti TaxID=3390035 RepID=UPI0039747D8F
MPSQKIVFALSCLLLAMPGFAHAGDPLQDALDALKKAEETVSGTTAGQAPKPEEPSRAVKQGPADGEETGQPADAAPKPDGSQAEIVFWQSIAASRNAADFEAYLARWPDGTFAALAHNRLEALATDQSPALEDHLPSDEPPPVAEHEPAEPDKDAELNRLVEEMESNFFGRDRPVDYARSYEIALQCAPMGHPKCMFRLGRLLETGRGVRTDPVAATDWYKKAAEAGEPYAMFNLGNQYFTGTIVPKDLTRAYSLYERAYQLNLTEAGYGLAMVLVDKAYRGRRDPDLAADFMLTAIQHGFDHARRVMIDKGQTWPRDFRMALQRSLRRDGFYQGAIDGDFGPGTKGAIERAFKTM